LTEPTTFSTKRESFRKKRKKFRKCEQDKIFDYFCGDNFNRNQMEIINKELIDKFIARHANSNKALDRWVEQMENATFKTHNELKLLYPYADYVGNNRYAFNIKGNDYRLVALVLFTAELITVCFIGTHAEYDKINCLTVLQ